ncbi:Cilia- and flagella-associated protein 57 [Aphanomyces cochlioides]|nr:Cilia- and flagella-associated protein 57 [Aphanomyces cochlioides]
MDESRREPDETNDKLALRPEFVLGVRGSIQNNVEFGSDNQLIFPAAHHLCLLNLDRRSMEFFHPTRGIRSVQSMCVSANRELVAVCEQASARFSKNISDQLGVNPNQISIYKLGTRARLKMLPTQSHAPILSVAFSADTRCLATLEDAPTYRISYWKWGTAKLVAHAACPSRGTRIRICPSNANLITISGPMVLRTWTLTSSGDLRMANLIPQIREQEHFVDHVWVRDYLVTVSEVGTLLTFRCTEDARVELIHSTRLNQMSVNLASGKVETIAASTKGFVLAGTEGMFGVFEFSDDPKDPFILIRALSAGEMTIESVAISPNCENVVAYTSSQRLVTLSMGAIDVVQDGHADFHDVIPNGTHCGSILTFDLSLQKPIVVTCGADKTIRSWNYLLSTYEVVAQLSEELLTMSLHPAGYQIAISFKERVRLYNILQDGLRVLREISMKAANALQFSHGGHLFACGAGLNISIYRTYTCDLVHTFSGHINAIQSLRWSTDDTYLYSAGNDGALYCWNTHTGNRCDDMQLVVKHCKFTSTIIDAANPKCVAVSGSDGKLREIQSGEETNSIDLGTPLMHMAITKSNRWLFIATRLGAVYVFAWPLGTQTAPVHGISVHSEPITQLRLTDDDRYLIRHNLSRNLNANVDFSSSEDGCVYIFRMDENTGHLTETDLVHRKLPAIMSDAVLVSREEIEDKNEQLGDLQQKYEQVKSDMDFSLHSKENEWIDRLRFLKEECEHSLVQERTRYEELEQRYQSSLRKHQDEFAQKESNHAKFSQELENRYEHKLAMEIARYDRLSEEMELTRQQCATLIEAQDKQQRLVLENERRAANSRAKEQVELIKRVKEDLTYNHVKFEEVLSQQEEDYEFQIQKLKQEYEQQLTAERQNTAIKETQITGKNSKIDSLKKKIQELKAHSSARDILLSTEKAKTAKLEAALANYEKHIEGLQQSIDEKEKSVQELKATNRVLESFRFVLNTRVEELQSEKSPMQKLISGLESRIHDVQEEMVQEFHQKDLAEETLASKDIKIKALTNEVNALRLITRKKESIIGAMSREFARIVLITNPKELERAVKDAYIVFVKGEAPKAKRTSSVLPKHDQASTVPTAGLSDDNREVVQEACKQMQFMHRSVATLKNALHHAKSEAEHRHREAITEGNILLQDMNALRKRNKVLELKVKEMESALYLANQNNEKRLKKKQEAKQQSLPTGLLSPLQKSASLSTLSPTQRVVVGSVLPFRAVESSKESTRQPSAATVQDYRNHIDNQKKDIQRLKGQVQLLLESQASVGRSNSSASLARSKTSVTNPSFDAPSPLSPTFSSAQTTHSISRRQSSGIGFALDVPDNNDFTSPTSESDDM